MSTPRTSFQMTWNLHEAGFKIRNLIRNIRYLLEMYQCHMSLKVCIPPQVFTYLWYLSRIGKKTKRCLEIKSLKAKT